MPSESTATVHARSDPPDAAIRAQLARILASEAFSRSQQLRRFLTFIVEQHLAGQGSSLKESVLANELYGKGTNFDGGADPIVRVDARRLRDKLREYYEGRSEPVVISLPKGSYVPAFATNAPSPIDAASPVVFPELSEPPRVATVGKAIITLAGLVVVATIIATALLWRAPRTSDAAPTELLPLASYPGTEGPPALSPDGSLVAFAWSGDAGAGPTDIFVKAVESEAIRRLTETPDAETSPAWSPDGQRIAFVRSGHGVFIMSHVGGAERQITTSGTHVAWAGDSKSVLIRDAERPPGPFGINQVFLDTLDRRRLTRAPIGAGDWRFEVSPDGNSLAFIRYEKRGIADLYVVPMAGGEPRRLTNWNATIDGVSWTPDGRQVIYSVQEPAASRLWRIDVNTATPARGSPIADIPASAMNPSISRPAPGQPARLAFQTLTRDVDLGVIDLAARTPDGTIASHAFANSTRIEGSAVFSPDGGRIAFASFRSGAQEIWVGGRDGSGLQQITRLGTGGITIGGWSPDGATIVFEAAVGGNTDVYLVGADGGHLRRLTAEPSIDGVPSWSADGRWIYFVSTRAGVTPNIWRISPDGGSPMRVTHNVGFQPQESPDGRYLYYLDGYPGGVTMDARLMRLPLAGGQEESVLEQLRPFLWSVTDTGIVFVTKESDFDAIDMYRFSDRRISRLGRLGFRIPGFYTHMTTSRDGRWAVATNLVRFDADLMRIDNFR
jgi:Tol biopolymer transport system component